jgi:ribosomal protein S18 acetylase RimI-like enzyme
VRGRHKAHVSGTLRNSKMNRATASLVSMDQKHVPAVVQVHLASFPGFFLSFLGPKFLAAYYSGVGSAPEGIAFVTLDAASAPCGFVVGSSNPRGFYKRLLRRGWFKFSIASIGPVLRRPSAAVRIARGLLHPGQNPAGDDIAGLFSIGVRPDVQGSGAGKLLVEAFLEEARRRQCKRVFLTTDTDENERTNRFYRGLGFVLTRQYVTTNSRNMNEYWIDL